MDFKEALIAHLQGDKVETLASCDRFHDGNPPSHPRWRAFGLYYYGMQLELLQHMASAPETGHEFRLAPRTITVNGVEVPAPESTFPAVGVEMWFPEYSSDSLVAYANYDGTSVYVDMLGMGLIYLNKEDAIARAKAMLLYK